MNHVPFSPVSPAALAELRHRLGAEAVRTDDETLVRYGKDETEALSFRPEAVLLPVSAAQVAEILTLAHRNRLPVTPRGAGTGLSGGALPVAGGLLLSIERMHRIRTVDRVNLTVEAEAGVVLGDLQRHLETAGLFYPPDPGSRETCLLGGTLAEDAAGPRSCKYGTTRRYVLGLEAVLADGAITRTGGRVLKNAAGYSLTQLLVGSEGTLAVITAATLRLLRQPAARLTLALPFPDLEPAARFVTRLFVAGHDPAACELMEEAALAAVAAIAPLPPQLAGHRALVLLELDGPAEEELLTAAGEIARLAEESGAGEAIAARDAAEQRRLWTLRSKIGDAVRHRSVYKEADTVVPRSELAALVRLAREVAQRHGIEAVCYGHAGDGNLHVNLLQGELGDVTWPQRRDAAERELFEGVVELGGSVTGEHGIGWTQRRHLPLVADAPSLAVMRRLKAAFDPRGILNPGKILAPAGDSPKDPLV